MSTKIKIIGAVGIFTIIVTLFSMWKIASNNYQVEKENRILLEQRLEASQKETQRLLNYQKQIEKENANIENKYNELFSKIPADTCGDAKPSAELLEFFKQGL